MDVVCHFYKGTWHASDVNITDIERHSPNFGPLAPVKYIESRVLKESSKKESM